MFWGFIIALMPCWASPVALSAIRYYKILQGHLWRRRRTFSRRRLPMSAKIASEVDHLTEFKSCGISMSQGRQSVIVISFDYERRFPSDSMSACLINVGARPEAPDGE